MTFKRAGFAQNHKPGDDKPTLLVIQAVIDNGEYKGTDVSRAFNLDRTHNTDLDDFLMLFPKPNTMSRTLEAEPEVFVEALNDQYGKDFRLSAQVLCKEQENDSKRFVRYGLTSFDGPTEEADLHLKSEPTQFIR